MPTLKSLSKLGSCLFMAFALHGCSVTSSSSKAVDVDAKLNSQKFNQLVSRDVVSVLRQITALSPDVTTLGLSREAVQKNAFAAALDRQLQANGYAIRSLDSSPNTIPVSYSFADVAAKNLESSDVIAQVVTVVVGDVAVRRSYAMDSNNTVRPLGNMSIRGADASHLVNDDDLFAPIAPKSEEPVKIRKVPQLVAEVHKAQTIEVRNTQTNRVEINSVQSASEPAPHEFFINEKTEPNAFALQLPDASAPDLSGSLSNNAASQAVNPNNIRYTELSNFESEFVDTRIVQEKVLTFSNDSIRMGDINKAQVSALLNNFKPGSDIVSIIGCSHGNTSLAGGQQALALGRAERVREELLFAGIPENSILAEGCWAGEHYDERMPRRGVIITLRRRLG